jgi:hypothetical protein
LKATRPSGENCARSSFASVWRKLGLRVSNGNTHKDVPVFAWGT